MSTIDATDETFADAINTGRPVLIDFWAQWCGPCRQVGPIVEKIAAEHDEYTVVKVDIDIASKTAQDFAIMSVPTLIVLDSTGQQVERFSGPKPLATLLASLERVG